MAGVEESVYSDSELESSESEDEEEPEQRSTTGPRPNAVYNVEAIHSKLEEISRPSEIDWIHFPTLNYEYTGEEIDVDDDLAREVFFYTQALEGARDAIEKLRPLKIPIVRPDDYYAEMVKSDKHMLRIKDKLLFQKQQIEEADQRRKQREAKKYSKEVQAEKVKERVQEKKRNIESLKKWRKNREESGYADEKDDFPIDLEDSKAPEGKRRKVENGAQDRGGSRVSSLSRGTGPSRKRQERDKKFGNGGRKGMMKKNTAESSADIGGFIKKFGGGRGDFKRGSRGGRGDFKRGSRGGRGEFRGGSRGGSRGGGKGKR